MTIDDEIKKIFKENDCYYEWDSYDGKVELHVEYGDWKHDHIFIDHVMREHGFFLTDEVVTEEDGSDTYSSIHYYIKL